MKMDNTEETLISSSDEEECEEEEEEADSGINPNINVEAPNINLQDSKDIRIGPSFSCQNMTINLMLDNNKQLQAGNSAAIAGFLANTSSNIPFLQNIIKVNSTPSLPQIQDVVISEEAASILPSKTILQRRNSTILKTSQNNIELFEDKVNIPSTESTTPSVTQNSVEIDCDRQTVSATTTSVPLDRNECAKWWDMLFTNKEIHEQLEEHMVSHTFEKSKTNENNVSLSSLIKDLIDGMNSFIVVSNDNENIDLPSQSTEVSKGFLKHFNWKIRIDKAKLIGYQPLIVSCDKELEIDIIDKLLFVTIPLSLENLNVYFENLSIGWKDFNFTGETTIHIKDIKIMLNITTMPSQNGCLNNDISCDIGFELVEGQIVGSAATGALIRLAEGINMQAFQQAIADVIVQEIPKILGGNNTASSLKPICDRYNEDLKDSNGKKSELEPYPYLVEDPQDTVEITEIKNDTSSIKHETECCNFSENNINPTDDTVNIEKQLIPEPVNKNKCLIDEQLKLESLNKLKEKNIPNACSSSKCIIENNSQNTETHNLTVNNISNKEITKISKSERSDPTIDYVIKAGDNLFNFTKKAKESICELGEDTVRLKDFFRHAAGVIYEAAFKENHVKKNENKTTDHEIPDEILEDNISSLIKDENNVELNKEETKTNLACSYDQEEPRKIITTRYENYPEKGIEISSYNEKILKQPQTDFKFDPTFLTDCFIESFNEQIKLFELSTMLLKSIDESINLETLDSINETVTITCSNGFISDLSTVKLIKIDHIDLLKNRLRLIVKLTFNKLELKFDKAYITINLNLPGAFPTVVSGKFKCYLRNNVIDLWINLIKDTDNVIRNYINVINEIMFDLDFMFTPRDGSRDLDLDDDEHRCIESLETYIRREYSANIKDIIRKTIEELVNSLVNTESVFRLAVENIFYTME